MDEPRYERWTLGAMLVIGSAGLGFAAMQVQLPDGLSWLPFFFFAFAVVALFLTVLPDIRSFQEWALSRRVSGAWRWVLTLRPRWPLHHPDPKTEMPVAAHVAQASRPPPPPSGIERLRETRATAIAPAVHRGCKVLGKLFDGLAIRAPGKRTENNQERYPDFWLSGLVGERVGECLSSYESFKDQAQNGSDIGVRDSFMQMFAKYELIRVWICRYIGFGVSVQNTGFRDWIAADRAYHDSLTGLKGRQDLGWLAVEIESYLARYGTRPTFDAELGTCSHN